MGREAGDEAEFEYSAQLLSPTLVDPPSEIAGLAVRLSAITQPSTWLCVTAVELAPIVTCDAPTILRNAVGSVPCAVRDAVVAAPLVFVTAVTVRLPTSVRVNSARNKVCASGGVAPCAIDPAIARAVESRAACIDALASDARL